VPSRYREWIEGRSRELATRIILSLDPPSPRRLDVAGLLRIVEEVSGSICAVKIGRQLTTPLGCGAALRRILARSHALGLPVVCDSKLSDVAHTNLAVARVHFKAGFDAEIVSPLPGWKGGLDPVFKITRRMGKGVIVLCYMSNPGASDLYGLTVSLPGGRKRKVYEVVAERAERWGADGLVVPATSPRIIKHVSSLARTALYAVGVGPQGGRVSDAVRSGASYVIVGRTITGSRSPGAAARRLAVQTQL